jgi:DNA-binding MarR family transcriptional regulator
MGEWSFLTNHARVLVCIARDPGVRLREIADVLGVTDGSASVSDARTTPG